MIKYIRWILGLCNHNWRDISTGTLTHEGDVVGRYYNQICTKCAKHRQEQVPKKVL